MIFSLFSRSHWHACLQKQTERQFDIDSLPPAYSAPLSSLEEKIHALSLSQLVSDCKAGVIAPSEVMLTYSKKTLIAQKLANCITDIMFDEALQIPSVVNWPHAIDPESSLARDRPLLGVPVSIKDTIDIAGHDSTIGYSRNVFHPAPTSSAIVRLLQDAGALVHVKTTAPTGLLGMETVSDIFGRTSNPYNNAYTSGASTGGGAALLACGGSKIEIGSDLGGSVRIPAHFCGVWSLKGSAGRFPSWGGVSSVQGLEGVPLVTAPMAGSLADLEEFWKRVVEAKPWEYDHTCLPIPWKSVDLQEEGRKLKWGVMLEDGVVPPSPACRRALRVVTAALRKQGHEVVDFSPPDVWSGLKIGYQLVFSDGGEQIRSLLSPSETLSKASASILSLLSLPRFIKRILAYFSCKSDPLTADALQIMHPKSVKDVRALNAQKEAYQAAWHEKWTESGLDFILSVPHPFPAFKHGESEKMNLMTAGFTFLFSMLDYTAGVLPVTFVDKEIDGLPDGFLASREYASMNAVAKGAYSVYDVEGMHGLPLGVQVVGRSMEEERVMEAMKVVEACLKRDGTVFIGNVKA